MLATTAALFDGLNDAGIRYCHWKSNWVLEKTLDGATDIDILVLRSDAPRFRALLNDLGFRPAIESGTEPFPSVEHYHALDSDSQTIVHVHSYYRVISGDSLAKNYRLPFEEMLLHDVRKIGPVCVPSAATETVSFVLRILLKHTTLIELAFIVRDREAIRSEAEWLLNEQTIEQAEAEAERWVPAIPTALFRTCLDALRRPAGLAMRIRLGLLVRKHLRSYERHRRMHAKATALVSFGSRALAKARGRRRGLTPGGGGAVIAFVGSEATGKSTMLDRTEQWLGEHFTVRRVHAGKPPSTLLTGLPNLLLPALRTIAPTQRTTKIEVPEHGAGPGDAAHRVPTLFAVRSVLLAHDRRALLRRAYADSANGAIILCDRYPAVSPGSPDSPQIARFGAVAEMRGTAGWLARREAAIYAEIPPPDLVIQLSAPLDVTLERNRTRGKTEPEDFVRRRHAMSSDVRFEGTPVHHLDTDRPLVETFRQVQRIIWDAL